MRSNPADFSKLIPDLSKWNNGAGIDIRAWLGRAGNIELAIGYSSLFWPNFVEFEGCVFCAGFSEESYRGFMRQCKGDRRKVEAVMNHRHIFDYFSHYQSDATAEQVQYLGRVLKEIWQAKLAADFPRRRFEVRFDEGLFKYLNDYQLTFWQAPIKFWALPERWHSIFRRRNLSQ